MTISPDRTVAQGGNSFAARLAGLLLAGALAAWPVAQAQAQARAAAQETAGEETSGDEIFDIAQPEEIPGDMAGDGAVDEPAGKAGTRTRYLGPQNLVPVERDAATGKPRSITPGPYVPPGSITSAAEVEEMASRAEPAAGEGTREGENASAPRSLLGMDDPEVGELQDLDPAAIGVLEPGAGGLPANLWRGTRRSTLEALIPQLPVGAPSPAMGKLVRQLLLSTVGVPPVSNDGDPGLALLEARLERVAASGNLAALLEMLERVAPRHETPAIRDIRADAYLMDSDILGACVVAREARGEEGGVKWLKILSLCQALDGDRSGVAFNIGLLQETGDATPLFAELIGRVLDRAEGVAGAAGQGRSADSGASGAAGMIDAALDSQPALDALTAALYRAAAVQVPVAVLDNTSAIVLASLAGRGDLDLDFRAEAAEIAALSGITPVADLVSAFDAMEFTEDEEASAFLLAETGLGARVDGLLYKLALGAITAKEKTRYLRAAWRRAHREGLYPALAGVLRVPAAQIPLVDDNISAAQDVARIALYAGDRELAGRWYELARSLASQRNVEATKALVDMWPLMIVAGVGEVPFSPQILNLWRQSLAILPVREQRRRATLLYGLLEALGYTIENDLWDDVLGAPAVAGTTAPSMGVWRQLLIATEAGRLGEGLLLSLVTVGDGGPARADLSALSSALRALSRLGFEDDARAIAVEALVAHGF